MVKMDFLKCLRELQLIVFIKWLCRNARIHSKVIVLVLQLNEVV